MSGHAFIGGNLQSIEDSAKRLNESGAMAVATGESTSQAAQQLEEAISSAMESLLTRFEEVAGTLTDDINASHSQLVGSDWQGASRDNAIAIKEHLQGQVTSVLGAATSNLGAEKTAFLTRAGALVESVNVEFKRVMTEVDAEYAQLADASRKTMENLIAADATIGMG